MLPVVYIIGVFIIYPILTTIMTAFFEENTIFNSDFFFKFISIKKNQAIILNTLIVGICNVLFCGIFGTFLAFLVNYYEFRFKTLANILGIIPIVIPGNLYVLSFVKLFGGTGIITSSIGNIFGFKGQLYDFSGLLAIIIIQTFSQYIYFYSLVGSGIEKLDGSLIEVAKSMGASPSKIFKDIIYPALKPSLFAAGVITFISGVSSFAAPYMVGKKFITLTVAIANAKSIGSLRFASVISIILMFLVIIILIISDYFEKNQKNKMNVRAIKMKKVNLNKFSYKFIHFFCIGVLFSIIILPIIGIFAFSIVPLYAWKDGIIPRFFTFENFRLFFSSPTLKAPFINSLSMSLISTLGACIIAFFVSYMIHQRKMKGKKYFAFLIMIPYIIPTSSLGINALITFSNPTKLLLGKSLVGTTLLLPLMYFVSGIPLIYKSTSSVMIKIPESYEEASRALGGNFIDSFTKIIFPLVLPGIVAGAILNFVGKIGEYTMAVLLYVPFNKPVSIDIVSSMGFDDIGVAMVYGVFITIISSIFIVIQKIVEKNIKI